MKTNPYAVDRRCHNVVGAFSHECEKPATWLGVSRWGHRSMYCQSCRDKLGSTIPQWTRADQISTMAAALVEAGDVLNEAVSQGEAYERAIARLSAIYNVTPRALRVMQPVGA